jgi:hypothetical protein
MFLTNATKEVSPSLKTILVTLAKMLRLHLECVSAGKARALDLAGRFWRALGPTDQSGRMPGPKRVALREDEHQR